MTNMAAATTSTPISISNSYIVTVSTETAEDRRRKAFEKYMQLPVIDDYDGPVYMNDTYYPDVDSALDACVDGGDHPAKVEAYPCVERKVSAPHPDDILYWVDEQWGENFEDYEGESWTPETKRAAEHLATALQLQAPNLWDADMKHRIVLAEPELDDAYDPGEDTYD